MSVSKPIWIRDPLAILADGAERGIVVKDGQIVGEGLNRSTGNFDPTSHGEVEAIRDACRNLKTLQLTDCDLYTSAEPCSMCVSTMLVAGIARMYYGVNCAVGQRISAPAAATARTCACADCVAR